MGAAGRDARYDALVAGAVGGRDGQRVETLPDWALTVVPDSGFVVLVSRRHLTEQQIMELTHRVPLPLRDRVLVVDGTRFQAAS